MRKLLLTGFEPFGGELRNSSMEVAERMAGSIGDWQVISLILPVSFDRCAEKLLEAVKNDRPDAVICLGQAGGRQAVTPEVVAINRMDSAFPDNDGQCRADASIRTDGPAAYFTTLPVKAMIAAMQQSNIPAALSYTAGTYVCNCLMYRLLDALAREKSAIAGGFIHLPYSREQVLCYEKTPFSLSLNELIKAVKCCVSVL